MTPYWWESTTEVEHSVPHERKFLIRVKTGGATPAQVIEQSPSLPELHETFIDPATGEVELGVLCVSLTAKQMDEDGLAWEVVAKYSDRPVQ